MEFNEQTVNELRRILLQTMSPDLRTRKEAEASITSIEVQPGFPVVVLRMISLLQTHTSQEDAAVRLSATIFFKNLVKNRWFSEDSEFQVVCANDRDAIKSNLIDLMCTTSPDVQRQLAEAVSIIAKHDFPDKWENLIPQLVAKLQAQDLRVTQGVALTANSIMKRFRNVNQSDELYRGLIICLQGLQAPLLQMYQQCGLWITALSTDKPQLLIAMETQRLLTRIFYSLNWQDLPEFFEDNIVSWMTEFNKYISYTNPTLVDDKEQTEPGPIEKLQAAIIENLNLYASKYEEEFTPFLPQFTQTIWQLLMQVGTPAKYDILATGAIKFLTSVSSKQMNTGLFTSAVLRDVVEHIVVRNLTATEQDEELFEDNPSDYIRKDIEGSDQDTRRRSACELVRSLLKFFNEEVSRLCTGYIGAMLEQYRVSLDWRAKDAALHLLLAASVLSSSAVAGAGNLNPNVDLLGIFGSHVLPEIHDTNVNARPIVKADAIKLVCVFRSHLQRPFLLELLPHIIRHMSAKQVVTQTYAAMCIEKFLSIKDRDPATGLNVQRILRADLAPGLEPLISGLFNILENPDMLENEYAMKCLMRTLTLVGSDIKPNFAAVLNKLAAIIDRVCKNPTNPQFNHFLFECLAVLIKSTCGGAGGGDVALCGHFESVLFPLFQNILTQDVVEFVPYAFQILALLQASRPAGSGLTEAYRTLFTPLLSPALWEKKGYVPALTDLFRSYLIVGGAEIAAAGQLTGVLGVFQKLLAAKATEENAFQLLDTLFLVCPHSVLQPYVSTIFGLLLRRMQDQTRESKTVRICRLFVHSACVLATAYDGQTLHDTLEASTAGLTNMIINNIWAVNAAACVKMDRPSVGHLLVGGAKLLCKSPVAADPAAWASLLKSLVVLLGAGAGAGKGDLDEAFAALDNETAEGREFDSAYCKLTFADVVDSTASFPELAQPSLFFAQSLAALCASQPGRYLSVIQAAGLDEKGANDLQLTMQQANLSLV